MDDSAPRNPIKRDARIAICDIAYFCAACALFPNGFVFAVYKSWFAFEWSKLKLPEDLPGNVANYFVDVTDISQGLLYAVRDHAVAQGAYDIMHDRSVYRLDSDQHSAEAIVEGVAEAFPNSVNYVLVLSGAHVGKPIRILVQHIDYDIDYDDDTGGYLGRTPTWRSIMWADDLTMFDEYFIEAYHEVITKAVSDIIAEWD